MMIQFHWLGTDSDDPFAVRDWPVPPAVGAQVRLRIPTRTLDPDTDVQIYEAVEGRVREVQIADTCTGGGVPLRNQPCAAVTLERIGVIS